MECVKRRKYECVLLNTNSDVLMMILKLLGISDIGAVASTCTKLRKLSQKECLWFYLLQRDFGLQRDPVLDKDVSSKCVYLHEKTFEEQNARGELSSAGFVWDLKNDIDTPLHFASREGMADAVKCCLRRGANPDNFNEGSFNALALACIHTNKQIAEILISKGAKLNTIYHELSGIGTEAMVEFALNLGVDVNKADDRGVTALMRACECGRLVIIKLLIAHGADPDMTDNEGYTALAYVRKRRQMSAIELLLNKN